MPRFDTPRPLRSTKILYIGHSSSGKTGSLCSLAAAGYTVRILDLDDGTELIDDFLMNKEKSIYRKARPGLWTQEQADTVAERMSYVTITEGYRLTGAKASPKGDSWAKIQNQLNHWKDGAEAFGNIATWKASDVLVIDGLSRLCESAMNFQLAMNNRLLSGPQVGTGSGNDYTQSYRMILDFLDMLKCTDIKCNIVMICHIKFLEVESGAGSAIRNTKGFPQTIGRMIAPQIPQYFNHTIQARSEGIQRRIYTGISDQMELKNTAPLRVKASYALETGLAEYFRDIRDVAYTAAGASPAGAVPVAVKDAAK